MTVISQEEFFDAVSHKNIDIIKKAIVEQGFDINTLDPTSGQSALHVAVSKVSICISLVDVLIQNGADCTIKNKYYGRTPLEAAVVYAGFATDEQRYDNKGKNLKKERDKFMYVIKVLLQHTPDKTVNWRTITPAIQFLAQKEHLCEDELSLLHKLSSYSDWHIRIAVVNALKNRKNLPPFIIQRFIDMQHDENYHIRNKVAPLIPKNTFTVSQIIDVFGYVSNFFSQKEDNQVPLLTDTD